MALGPKAMGEAIAHNLKPTTGRSLEEWLATLDAQQLADRRSTLEWLKGQGLGHFQAQLVVDRRDGLPLYDDPGQVVDDLFSAHPAQRPLYEKVVDHARESFGLTANPCKGYVPLYSPRNRIVVSMKPTADGLYLGLIGDTFSFPVVPHKRSLGGSERMTRGVYVQDAETAIEALAQSVHHDSAQ